jgi:hypothetical protein
MVSSNKADLDLRENTPLSRNILHTAGLWPTNTGQRTDQKIWHRPTGHRDRLSNCTGQKVSTGYLTYPADVRDSAKSGLGLNDNRHLNDLVESISTNVGGSQQNAKVSSPPMTAESVGGVIVLGAQESCALGEGRQEHDVST